MTYCFHAWVLFFVCASLKIHYTDFLIMWFGGKKSCCTVAKQVIQQRGSKDLILAKLLKCTNTWKIFQLQKALLKLQNVWNTKITLGYATLIYLPLDIHYVFNHMVRISIFVCSTTTPFNTANDYSESAKGNLRCRFPLQWRNSKWAISQVQNSWKGNSNLLLTECPSKNTRFYLLGASAVA